MRYRGGGVGHKATREATNFFINRRHDLDLKAQKSGGVEGVHDHEWEDIPFTPSSDIDSEEGMSDISGDEGSEVEEESDEDCDDLLGPEDGIFVDELDEIGLASQ